MRYGILFMLALVICSFCSAQTRFGLELGCGQTPTNFREMNEPVRRQADMTLRLQAYYQRKVDRHIYLGANLFLEQYSIKYSTLNWQGSSIANLITNTMEVEHRSSYLFLAPCFDLGIGRKQIVHMYVAPAVGFLMNGFQSLRNYETGGAHDFDHTDITSSYIESVVFRLGAGITEHIKLSKIYHVTFNVGMNGFVISDNSLSRTGGTNNLVLDPNYMYCSMGIMRKYKTKGY